MTLLERPLPGPDPAPLAGDDHGRAHCLARRAGHPRRARPLPLRLRRADDQPRPAAALRQRRGQAHGARHRHGAARAHRRRHRARVLDAGQLRRLRHLGSVGRRHVADELRHRLPDAGQGGRLRRAPAALQPGARPAAELHQLRAGLRDRAARGAPMRSTCSPATAARRSASCATTSTPSSTASRRRWPRLSSAPRSPCWATRRAPRRRLQAALKTIADKDDGVTRRDYGTSVRDGAALITLASESGLAKAEVPRLVDVVAKAYRAKSYTSTQEQAWMLLAARALAEEAGNADAHGQRRCPQGPAGPPAVAGRGQGRRARHRQRRATPRSMPWCR